MDITFYHCGLINYEILLYIYKHKNFKIWSQFSQMPVIVHEPDPQILAIGTILGE